MDRKQSADDVRCKHLDAMGEELGRVYHALYEEVVWLHAKWIQYRKLFAESPHQVELLNATAPYLFRVLQIVMWDDILLHIARLTDPPKSANKDNLSLRRLPIVLPDSSTTVEVSALVDLAVSKVSFARAWRNRRLAHCDLELALDPVSAGLPGTSRGDVEQVLECIRDVLNCVHRKYFDQMILFEHFIAGHDAESLVYYLREAKKAEDARRE